MYHVYILQSQKNKRLYKGYTTDLKKRVTAHNTGKNASTKAGMPWRLVYYQGFLNKADARREEEFLKSGKGRERIALLLQETLKKIEYNTERCQRGRMGHTANVLVG